MRIGKWAGFLLVAAPLIAGCGNFWEPLTGGGGGGNGGCTTNCSTATGGNFYLLNNATPPQVEGFSIVSGKLTAISGSPWTLPSTPYAMAMAPNGNFMELSTTSGVFAYPITNGALGTPVAASGDLAATAIAVDTTNSWLLEVLPGTGGVTISAVPISTTTGIGAGTESTASFNNANAAVHQMTISGDNRNIFVALGAGGALVLPFNANPGKGISPLGNTAATIGLTNSDSTINSVAVDPGAAPRLFYIGETNADAAGTSGALFAYNYSSLGSGTLTQATGSPIASGGLAPNFILPVTTPDYAYVANGTGAGSVGNITGFAISGSSAPYTIAVSKSNIATGIQPVGLAEDSTGAFVLAISSLGSPYFQSFTFDSTTTGQLDAQLTSSTQSNFTAIVAAPAP